MTAVGSRLTTAITYPAALAAGAAVKMGLDFDRSMSRIKSLTGTSEKQTRAWAQQVIDMGRKLPQGPQQLADALYFIASSGFQGAGALKVLKASAQAAAAGLGDTQVIADAVTSAVNTYGEKALSAASATDVLTAAVRVGKGEPDAIGAAIGRVIPIAEQMGVTFGEVGGQIAALTLRGFSAQKAVTGVRAIMIDLLKPSIAGKEILSDLGWTIDELHKSIDRDMVGTLEQLRSEIGDDNVAWSKLLDNSFAMNAAQALVGKNLDKTRYAMEEVTNSTGETDRAFQKASETMQFKFDKAWANVKATLIEVGRDTLLPIVTNIAEAVGKAAKSFSDLEPEQKMMILRFIGIAAAAGPVLLVLGSIASAVAALITPIGAVVAIGAALVARLGYLYASSEEFRSKVNEIAKVVGGALKVAFGIIVKVIEVVIDVFGNAAVAGAALAAVVGIKLVKAFMFLRAAAMAAIGAHAAGGIIGLFRHFTGGAAVASTLAGSVTHAGAQLQLFSTGTAAASTSTAGLAASMSAALPTIGLVAAGIGAAIGLTWLIARNTGAYTERLKENYNQHTRWIDQLDEAKRQISVTAGQVDTYRRRHQELKAAVEEAEPGTKKFIDLQKQLTQVEDRLADATRRHTRLIKERRDLEEDITSADPGLRRSVRSSRVDMAGLHARRILEWQQMSAAGQFGSEDLNEALSAENDLATKYQKTTDVLAQQRKEIEKTIRSQIKLTNQQQAAVRFQDDLNKVVQDSVGMDAWEFLANAGVETIDSRDDIKYAIERIVGPLRDTTTNEINPVARDLQKAFAQVPFRALKGLQVREWEQIYTELAEKREGLIGELDETKSYLREVGEAMAFEVREVTRNSGPLRAMRRWFDEIAGAATLSRDPEATGHANGKRIMEGFMAGLLERSDVAAGQAETAASLVINELAKPDLGKLGRDGIGKFARGIAQKSGAPVEEVRDMLEQIIEEFDYAGGKIKNSAADIMKGARRQLEKGAIGSRMFRQITSQGPGASSYYGVGSSAAKGTASGIEKNAKRMSDALKAALANAAVTGEDAAKDYDKIGRQIQTSIRDGIKSGAFASKEELKRHIEDMLAENDVFIQNWESAITRGRGMVGLGPVPGRGGVPGLYKGAVNFQGGPAIVGEKGPELVVLPQHASVIPAPQTAGMIEQLRAAGIPGFARGTEVSKGMKALGNIVDIGKAMQRMGYLVGEHPAFGGVAPVHTANSYHYRGMALDVNWPGSDEMQKLDALYSWIRTNVTGIAELLWRTTDHFDHLHLAVGPGGVFAGGLMGALMDPSAVLRKTTKGIHVPEWAGGVAGMPQAEHAMMRRGYKKQLEKWAAQAMPFMGGDLGMGGNVNSWAKQAMKIVGAPNSWLSPLLQTIQAESSGNPKAYNPSGASGIAQVKPATFAAYALPGMRDIWNPVHNLVASLRYRNSRYAGGDWTPYGPIAPYASGGISLREHIGRVSEKGMPEAHIPLRGHQSKMFFRELMDSSDNTGIKLLARIADAIENADGGDIIVKVGDEEVERHRRHKQIERKTR